MNKSEKFLNVSGEIPNTSKEITQWRKDNKIEAEQLILNADVTVQVKKKAGRFTTMNL